MPDFRFIQKKIIYFFVSLALILCSPSWAAQNARVLLQTDLGNIVIELFPREAPVTVKSFLDYVDSGFYNGTIFHRVTPGFIIQGGGLEEDFTSKKIREPIKSESNNGLKNDSYMVAMAHANDGDLSGAQFFINLQTNQSLNSNRKEAGYTVFGKVVEGMDIAEKISLSPRGMYDQFPEAPNTPVHIIKVERIDRGKNRSEGDTFASHTEHKSITEKPVSSPE